MSSWLGVGILLVFSLGLNLFMRLERKPNAAIPDDLRRWNRIPSPHLPQDVYVERRVVEVSARGFGRYRWVEQRRIRRLADDTVVQVLDEQPFRRP